MSSQEMRHWNHTTGATLGHIGERHRQIPRRVYEEQLGRRVSSYLESRLLVSKKITLRRNDNLYNVGEQGTALYFIESGLLKTSSYSRCGKACLLNLYTGGDVVGESALLDQPRTETATAMLPTVLYQIPRNEFLRMLADKTLVEAWLRYLTSRMSEQKEAITLLVTVDSKQRLAVTLLRLASRIGRWRGGALHIDYRITQEELAEMVGTTRSRVGLFLKQFRAAGLINIGPNSALIIDESNLRLYVEARS